MWLDTFNQMRKQSGISLDELSEKSGVPKGTLTKITSGVTKGPSLEAMRSLVYAMGYTLKDLDEGLEHSNTFSKEEREHIKKYRALDGHGRKMVDFVLGEESARVEKERAPLPVPPQPDTEAVAAPAMVSKIVYINPAAAGVPLYAESEYERREFPADEVPWDADFGVRISGRSMEPTIRDGAIVWVRKTPDVEDGQIGVFMLGDSAACKRLERLDNGSVRLISDNPDQEQYKPVEIGEFEQLRPVGLVLQYK